MRRVLGQHHHAKGAAVQVPNLRRREQGAVERETVGSVCGGWRSRLQTAGATAWSAGSVATASCSRATVRAKAVWGQAAPHMPQVRRDHAAAAPLPLSAWQRAGFGRRRKAQPRVP